MGKTCGVTVLQAENLGDVQGGEGKRKGRGGWRRRERLKRERKEWVC